jgi:hypothetical protein
MVLPNAADQLQGQREPGNLDPLTLHLFAQDDVIVAAFQADTGGGVDRVKLHELEQWLPARRNVVAHREVRFADAAATWRVESGMFQVQPGLFKPGFSPGDAGGGHVPARFGLVVVQSRDKAPGLALLGPFPAGFRLPAFALAESSSASATINRASQFAGSSSMGSCSVSTMSPALKWIALMVAATSG